MSNGVTQNLAWGLRIYDQIMLWFDIAEESLYGEKP